MILPNTLPWTSYPPGRFLAVLAEAVKQASDGTCNALPGWTVSLTPIDSTKDEACTAYPEAGKPGDQHPLENKSHWVV